MRWVVYMLRCADGSYYTGITNDYKRRLWEHNFSKRGAKYTRSRRPVKPVFTLSLPTRSDAAKKEAALKKLTHQQKVRFDCE